MLIHVNYKQHSITGFLNLNDNYIFRVTFGGVSLMPTALDSTSLSWKMQVSTIVHELTHVLGFVPHLMQYFVTGNTP